MQIVTKLRKLPSNVWTNFPVAISNTLIIPSMAPLARYFPSGLCKVCNILNKEIKKIKIINFDQNNENLFLTHSFKIHLCTNKIN